ncbi:MAG: lipoyl(octanoyl) transferase LipB [Calothrix sp. SM1_7_51]|nr:lipoyl(octanoyl) transferase LipB [Calothrix sp. SM1_7_51]
MISSNTFDKRKCLLYNEGLMPYLEAHAWQKSLQQARIQDPNLDDVLILLEHPPVYTLGQGASTEFLKFDKSQNTHEIHRIERGGEVTYHCPGQIVGYPILNLQSYRKDLHWYLRQLEEVLIRTIAVYGLKAERLVGLTGVWVSGRKVAAIGIKVSRWVTIHGFALNVCPDMTGFEIIIPCGITDKDVASLAEWLPGISSTEVRQEIAKSFTQVFGIELVEMKYEGEYVP